MADKSNADTICVIGNLNIDLIIRNVPGMPAWGQEVMGDDHFQTSSGQAGYLAFALSRLGIPTSLVGNVGDDLYGKQIMNDLTAFGVNSQGVKVMTGQGTGITVAIVRADGERAFISDLACLHNFSEELVEQNWDQVKPASVVCLVGLFCIPGMSFQAAARQLGKARKAGKPTMLDTGWDPQNWSEETLSGMQELLKEVTLFLPNWDEAKAITGRKTVEDAALALQELGPDMVVIKCGEEGSFARFGNQSCRVLPRPVQVRDAVGAGDVFNAGFLLGLRHEWPIEACLAIGNTAASLYISRKENRFPRLDEVFAAGRDYSALAAILDLENFGGGRP